LLSPFYDPAPRRISKQITKALGLTCPIAALRRGHIRRDGASAAPKSSKARTVYTCVALGVGEFCLNVFVARQASGRHGVDLVWGSFRHTRASHRAIRALREGGFMKSELPGRHAAASAHSGSMEPHEPELDPPFDVLGPEVPSCPLVLSSPHSGSIYPKRFLDGTKLDLAVLRRSEDAFVDELFSGAAALGGPLIRARFPRAYLDVNREPYELDPRMFDGAVPGYANTRSVRVAGGLGTIPRVAGQAQEIYAARLPVSEALGRIEKLHKPYHRRLRGLVERARAKFGVAVLIDCHSMPSGLLQASAAPGVSANVAGHRPDIVVGDRYGTSCASALVDLVVEELKRLGYAVARNKPYAGGYITEHYGTPSANCHAMQIEICRALYMDERAIAKVERFAATQAALTKVVGILAAGIAAGFDVMPRAAAE
jgi:N-formylglutamate amidohydrolase